MLINILQKRKSETSTGEKRLRLWAAIALGLVWLLCSCTTANYGKLQSSFEVSQLFENAQILSDHMYYFNGLQGVPDAIVGIHPNYSLQAKTWQPVDLTSATLKKWIVRMTYVHQVTPRGAWILGPDGVRLGIWFSAQRQTTVRLEKENRLVVVAPLPPELRGVP